MTQRVFFHDFQRDFTQKLRMGKQSFLCRTHCLNLIFISINYHEDILKIVYGRTAPCHNTTFFQNRHIINSCLSVLFISAYCVLELVLEVFISIIRYRLYCVSFYII